MSNRKAFNFLRSYYDVYNMLDNESDKKEFIEAVMNRQFKGLEPLNLSKMAEFAYNSQKHSIDKSVSGFETKTKTKLVDLQAYSTPTQAPWQGPTQDPCQQEKEEEKEKEKEEYILSGDKSPNMNIDFIKLLKFINQKTGRNFRTINQKVKKKYKARLKEGYTNKDIANSILNACNAKNHKENNYTYLTPEFFSRSDILDKYGFDTKQVSSNKIQKKDFISNIYNNED